MKQIMNIDEQMHQDLLIRIQSLEKENAELKQKYYTLEDINQCFTYALEQSSIVIFRQDKDLKYKWIHNPNPALKIENALEKTDYELLPFHEASKLHEIKSNVIKTGISANEIVETTIQGKTFIYELIVTPWLDKNNETIGITCLSTDITKKERELIIAKEKAEDSDRLKTAFIQNMSHEIRTPLNAIYGFAGILNKSDLSEEKRKSFTQIIQNSSNQLISIVSDILTFSSLKSKQEEPDISKVCINCIIVELLAIFQQQAINQNILIYAKQQLNDQQSEIFTDKTKITQILTNLLSNAFKFTHKGFIEFGYNLKFDNLEFYVKDSGIGIKPEDQEKIFEPFRQADKSISKLYGGTGLGLAISKAFVELLGGQIWVKSKPDKGSIFYFTIPYKPVNEIDKTISPIKQNENFKTIIVAEDEEFNFLFIEELLIDLDLKLIHTKDGQETVEAFKANPNIDLILMDIRMPVMTGHEAAKIIKSLNPDLPIIAQSAYALEHQRAKYEGIFDDYLTKPLKGDVLIEVLSKYIEIKK
jgi:signal transduction histidine kinase/CheY-like chemotaxis protein